MTIIRSMRCSIRHGCWKVVEAKVLFAKSWQVNWKVDARQPPAEQDGATDVQPLRWACFDS